MERRATLLRRPLSGPSIGRWAPRLLLAACVVAQPLLAPKPARAQTTPRLAISEVGWEFRDRDATREFWEIANLGDTDWDPNNYWLFRARFREDNATETPQLWVKVSGVKPIPPGDVLLIEWGRPLEEGADTDVAGVSQGNIFVTGREGFNSTDLEQNIGLAVFGPTGSQTHPDVDAGTMLAYYFQGDLAYMGEGMTPALVGHDKAVASKLWKQGDVAGPSALDWSRSLRMGPGGYPADHGRKAADYYLTLAGVPSLDNAGLGLVLPPDPSPNTKNRAATPGKPNYLHPGGPIPGQIMAGFYSVRAQAAPASLAANAAPAALQVAGLSADGAVATTLFTNNTWSPVTKVAGAPAATDLSLVNNAVRGSRTLVIRSKADGALMATTATTGPDFGALADMGIKAQFAPATAVDAAGNEHFFAVEAGTGNIMHSASQDGKLSGWTAIPGATTDAPVAAAFAADPGVLAVAAFNGKQLVLSQMGADGKFGAWQNVGSALSDRPAGIGPVLAVNAPAKRLEIFALQGTGDVAELQHARAELQARDQAKVGALAKVADIVTNAAPAVAVNDAGQIHLLARHGGKEPALNPREDEDQTAAYGEGLEGETSDDPGDPQAGFVFGATFDGSAWGTASRVGAGRLPGVSKAEPMFTAPAAPVSLFDANTEQFQDLLIGEDSQIYFNTTK